MYYGQKSNTAQNREYKKMSSNSQLSESKSNNGSYNISREPRKFTNSDRKVSSTTPKGVLNVGKTANFTQDDTFPNVSQPLKVNTSNTSSNAKPRESSLQSNFLFNTNRQDSIGSILNSYSMNNNATSSQAPNSYATTMGDDDTMHATLQSPEVAYPSYYLGHNQDLYPVSGNHGNAEHSKSRAEVVYLPPPTSSQFFHTNGSDIENLPATANNSRTNSIFNLLVQLPQSTRNSTSEESSISQKGSYFKNALSSTEQNIRQEEKAPLSGSKVSGSGSDYFAYAQGQSYPEVSKSISKGKRGSLGLNFGNSFWEGLNNGSSGSVFGLNLTNDDINELLAGLSNGSIDFNHMNDDQRRDSIIKFLGESGKSEPRKYVPPGEPRAKLKEDIFETKKDNFVYKRKLSLAPNSDYVLSPSQGPKSPGPEQGVTNLNINQTSSHPTSRTFGSSNISSSNSVKNGNPRVLKQRQEPQDVIQGFYAKGTPANYENNIKNGLITENSLNNRSNPLPEIKPSVAQIVPKNKLNENETARSDMVGNVDGQRFYKGKFGKPFLGSTKIDELMLVIQSKDSNMDSSIHAAPVVGEEVTQERIALDETPIPHPESSLSNDEKTLNLNNNDGDILQPNKKSKKKQCPYCFKYFNQSTHLEVHVRSHIGYKPFECSFCHKRFTQGGNLRTHYRLHTGEKPFTCKICNRSFSRKGNLAAHELTHQNLRPFKCKLDGCDKSFTQLGNLKSHQNRFHLATLNSLTEKLAKLTAVDFDNLPKDEKELLNYFKELYKNSNKGIRGRGKRNDKSV